MRDIDVIVKFSFANLERNRMSSEEASLSRIAKTIWRTETLELTKLLISFSRSGADRAVA